MSKLTPHLFITTDPASLFYRLEKKIFDKDSLFRQVVLVPSSLIKEELYRKMLSCGICSGFKVFELAPGIDYLMRAVRFDDKKGHSFPAPMLLSIHLQALIKESLLEENPLFASLKSYVYSQKQEISIEKRIQGLSEALSLDFLHYGLYGGDSLAQWLEKPSWQTILWKKVFSSWDYPYKAFEALSEKSHVNIECEVHLFGFSFIPMVYENFFSYLSSFIQFHYYYLTPSAYFWGEFVSKKELLGLEKFYKKRGVTIQELKELKSYHKEDHTLLTNFGKQTQRRYNYLLDQEFFREEFFFEEEELKEKRLLSQIKKELFEGKTLEEKVLLDAEDDSIQVHKSPSRKREVEVLLSTLMNLCDKSQIEPSDVLVVAPDISLYFPFIRQIFEFQSPFSVEVHDLEIQSQSLFLQGLWSLFSLYESRWEEQDVFALLTIEPLLNKFEIKKEEVVIIRQWVEESHILWGYNAAHRKELITRCEQSELEALGSEQGTWSYGLERLLMGLVVSDKGFLDGESAPFYPINGVSADQAKLLGRFIHLLHSLYGEKDHFLVEKKPLADWIVYFREFADQFFSLDKREEDSGFLFFKQQIKTLEPLALKLKEAPFRFSTLKRFFEKTFCKKGAVFSNRNKNAICFASIQSQQLYPVKVLCFLGMEEESFPSRLPHHPLRELEEHLIDPVPSSIEEQRQVLLDATLYAQEHLIFSYSSFDEKDGKEKGVSFLIQEFLDYFDLHFTYGTSVSKKICYSHKSFSFHMQELLGENGKKHYLLRDFLLAKAFYHLEKEKKRFIPEFYQNLLPDIQLDSGEKIVISQLQSFARNPLRYYMNHQLGIYLKKQRSLGEKINKEFVASSLDKAIFKQGLLYDEFDLLYQSRQLEGAMPSGIFGEISKKILQEESSEFLEAFKVFDIDISTVFSIELHPQCEGRAKNIQNFTTTPLEVILEGGEKVFIEGKIENVCSKGLIFYGGKELSDYLKIWPLYLVFLAIIERDFSQEIGSSLFFMKALLCKKKPSYDPLKALSSYLSYYKKGQKSPSPLMPIWGEAFLEQPYEERDGVIQKTFFNRLQSVYLDDYQTWCFENLEPFCAVSMTNNWGDVFEKTFQPLLTWQDEEDVHG